MHRHRIGFVAYRDFFHEERFVAGAVANGHAFWSHFQLRVGLRPFWREFGLGGIPDDLGPPFFPLSKRHIAPQQEYSS